MLITPFLTKTVEKHLKKLGFETTPSTAKRAITPIDPPPGTHRVTNGGGEIFPGSPIIFEIDYTIQLDMARDLTRPGPKARRILGAVFGTL